MEKQAVRPHFEFIGANTRKTVLNITKQNQVKELDMKTTNLISKTAIATAITAAMIGIPAFAANVMVGDKLGTAENEIRAALEAKGYEILEIEREFRGFEAEVIIDGEEFELEISADGTIIEIELEDDDEDDDDESAQNQ